MSLFFDLRVTDGPTPSSLGLLEVQRTSHTDVSDPGADTWCEYTVRVDDREMGTVQHRYGDPPWALIGKAANAVWAHLAMATESEPRKRINAAARVRAMGQVDGTRLVSAAIEAEEKKRERQALYEQAYGPSAAKLDGDGEP